MTLGYRCFDGKAGEGFCSKTLRFNWIKRCYFGEICSLAGWARIGHDKRSLVSGIIVFDSNSVYSCRPGRNVERRPLRRRSVDDVGGHRFFARKRCVGGRLQIPRGKGFTDNYPWRKTAVRPVASAKLALPRRQQPPRIPGPLAQLAAHTNLVDGIKKQFLGDAGPEANGKFDELMSGLVTGKMDMNGLRAQAKSAADQLRAMKKDMGGEGSVMLDAYLGILDKFLAEEPEAPAPAGVAPAATNSPQGITIIR